jgi:hypothetical protein
MTRNLECRRQIHEVLCGYEVGHQFILEKFLTDMQERHWPKRNRTKRQPIGRVSNILGEYVRAKSLSRTTHSSTGLSTFKVVKQVV